MTDRPEHEGHTGIIEDKSDEELGMHTEMVTRLAECAHAMEAAAEVIQRISAEHGFWDDLPRNKGEMISLMHSELSEMLEAVRDPSIPMDKHCPSFYAEEIELADLIIRALDYAHGHDLRLGKAFVAKVLYNNLRPRKHGKKF